VLHVCRFPGNAAFLQRFSDFIKKENADPLAAQSVYAARGYDAMTALLQAYAAAQGSKDGPAIVATLQRQNFTGGWGVLDFGVSTSASLLDCLSEHTT
jgi:ABC-type branched-subunit amino acid transport system substrate-binding protein